MKRINHEEVIGIIDKAGTKPVEVSQIGTTLFKPTGKWSARCYSKRLGYMEQWGDTEIEALKNLSDYVQIQGDIWPPITQGDD